MNKTLLKIYKNIAKNRIVSLVFSCCLITIFIATARFLGEEKTVPTISEITNWGLSFQKEGETPIGNKTSEYLKKYDSYFVGNEEEKVLYLTFDAGYENGNTEKILEVLGKHNVKATFFLVGNYIETEPELVKKMDEQGHTVGNHTWSHPDMSKLDNMQSFKEELEKVSEKYKEITGKEMLKLYRPPQGKYCESNLENAQSLGYKTIFWSLAYVDWYADKQPSKEEAFSKLIPRIHNGAIVLLHSTSKTNADILDELITKWKDLGYEFGSVEDI